jgi:glycosyltransferase involved in cell wall biosynthesis
MKQDCPAETSSVLKVVGPMDVPDARQGGRRAPSWWQRLRRLGWHVLARQFTLVSVVALALAQWIGRKGRPVSGTGCEILLTGRFDSTNWILAHLGPLAASRTCTSLCMVSTKPVPVLPKVTAVYPPTWLVRAMGATPARLLTFLWTALRHRPHIVGGFGLMVNGITAVVVGKLTGARSLYFCVGGPAEVHDGGIRSAENFFAKMETADRTVEGRLLQIAAAADAVITMGTGAVRFFRAKGVHTDFHVVSGGIDGVRFQPARDAPSYDLILTGRLVEIKRVDVFLQAVHLVTHRIPTVKAVVVGDGRLRRPLQARAADLGLAGHVDFVGHQDDVENWLRRARLFVLTSDSEGLSLALMEAMMCGLPAVVSQVGDLEDLVEHGVSGYLVPRRSPELFAERISELLLEVDKWQAFSEAARRTALRYEMSGTVRRWDGILTRRWARGESR